MLTINKDRKIGADSLNIILYHRQKKNWKVGGYFATLSGALHELILHQMIETVSNKLQDAVTARRSNDCDYLLC